MGNVLPLRYPHTCIFPPSSEILTNSGLGSGILFTYPQLATIAGVQGVVTYALTSALPLLIFAALGPIIRRKCPEGFVLTEWVRQRYGVITALWLSFLTLVTMFLYMVSELSAIGEAVSTLTGLDALPILIVECVVTTIYTCKSADLCSHSRPTYTPAAAGLTNISGSPRRLQSVLHDRQCPRRHGPWPHTDRYHHDRRAHAY